MTPTRRATDVEQVLNLLPARFGDWYLTSKTSNELIHIGVSATYRSRVENSFRATVNVSPGLEQNISEDGVRGIDLEIGSVIRALQETRMALDPSDVRRTATFVKDTERPGRVGVMIFAEPAGHHEALTLAECRACLVKIRAAWVGIIGCSHYEGFVRAVARALDLFGNSGLI